MRRVLAVSCLLAIIPTFAQASEAARRLARDAVIADTHIDAPGILMERWADLDKQGRLDVALSAAELVERVPLFAKLPTDKRSSIARLLKPRMTLPGDPIVRRGQRGDAMYFIASGAAAGCARSSVRQVARSAASSAASW